jgi:hypothetical protein
VTDGETSGSAGHAVTRRSFVKRTGGATVATLVAWNMTMTAQRALAMESIVDGGSTSEGDADWKVRSAPVGLPFEEVEVRQYLDISHGPIQDWTPNNVAKKVRRVLHMFAYAPANPADAPVSGSHNFAYTAKCEIKVRVEEWAEIADVGNDGQPVNWTNMTQGQWNSWTNSEHVDSNTFVAYLTKQVLDSTKAVPTLSITENFPVGVNNDDTKSDGGIYIKLTWSGDSLNIVFRALGLGIEENDYDIESVWELRNYGNAGQP